MLRRFDSINDCVIFERYRWNPDFPGFHRIDLTYGGTGAVISSALGYLT